jgi:gliding motility-associated-like protein
MRIYTPIQLFCPRALFWACLLQTTILVAQPANDNCTNAFEIPRQASWCGDFDNKGATLSGYSQPFCFSGPGNDLWYQFTAIASEVTVTVLGRGSGLPLTMVRPEVVLYKGVCGGQVTELRCASAPNGTAEVIHGGLVIGETYYIRVQSGNVAIGTFRLCLSNYNPPAIPSGDCPTAALLCDKSPFAIRKLRGGGANNREMQDAPCFFTNGINPPDTSSIIETDVTWFKWTCLASGTLTFSLTPINIDDDIDFALYELPNGIDNCTNKIILRCMAAGPRDDRGSQTSPTALRCHGATGLSLTATDLSEPSSCLAAIPHDNFVRALDMVAGKSYALAINNYDKSGSGFNIDFGGGGTGTFLGPDPQIKINKPDKKLCLGEDMLISDGSTFALGNIVERFWSFGKDASLDTTRGVGPFNVYYKTPGWKTIALTVTSDRGCTVTTVIDSIFVKGFSYDTASRQPTCRLGSDGMVRARVTTCGRAPLAYSWNGAPFVVGKDSLGGVPRGNYRLIVSDASRLYFDTVRFVLSELEIQLDTALSSVNAIHCFGDSTGWVQLKPSNGAQPYQYDWFDGRGLVYNSSKGQLPAGTYQVRVVDSNACKGNFTLEVTQPPHLEVAIDTFNISCFGLTDGRAIAYGAGGTPILKNGISTYRYNWNTGTVGSEVKGLGIGTYQVTVIDGFNCESARGVRIVEPPEMTLSPKWVQMNRCFGDSTGQLAARAIGGTPPFRFSIDGVHYQADSTFVNIPGRTYHVTVRDSTGCKKTIDMTVPEPAPIQVNAGPDITIDLGFSIQLRAVAVPSNNQYKYLWTPKDSSIRCPTCQNTVVTPIATTAYRISVRDTAGCMGFDELLVKVVKNRPVYFPNVFSPNNDGVNDWFSAYSNPSAVKIMDMKIFNRWGGMVFQTQNIPLDTPNLGWNGLFNGEPLEGGVFAFMVKILFIDGEEILYTGDITLVR